MRSLVPVVLIAAILALLFVTNPTGKDFSEWYGNKAAAAAPAGGVGKVLGGIGKGMASLSAGAFQRKNYGIFSVFSATKAGAAYLGLGKVVFVKIR